MTSVLLESNMLRIPEEFANELGLYPGIQVEISRTSTGIEIRPVEGLRRGADGVWRTREQRKEILDRLAGQGKRLGICGGTEEFVKWRTEDDELRHGSHPSSSSSAS